MSLLIKILSGVIFLLFHQSLFGQGPQIITHFPLSQKVDAQATTVIEVTFDQAISPSSVNDTSFRVFGRWSGPSRGSFSLLNGNTGLRFTPNEPFFAGEWMTVSLSKKITSSSGTEMSLPFSWNFWIKTGSGTLQQNFLAEIPLRETGEGLIQTYGAYAGDINNDGYSDFTVINETSDDLRILLNDGTGAFPAMDIHPMGDGAPSPSEGADLNNDGEIDLAVCSFTDNAVRLLSGMGNGQFQPMNSLNTGDTPRGLAILDFNGDGWDDLATANRFGNNLTLFSNNRNGTFASSTINPVGNGETALAATDVNNDGIQDLFIGFYSTKEIGILLGNGSGGFSLSDKVTVLGAPWMIACGDLNGDGHADVVSANSTGNNNVVILGDGLGGLGTPQNYSVNGAQFPLAIDLGDLDGDGDLDMVNSNYVTSNFIVFENNGFGSFTHAATLSAPDHASCAVLHDRDNDGDLDISGTDEGADVIILFDNDLQVSVENPETDPHFLEVFPNPAQEKITISYLIVSPGEVNVHVRDIAGRLVHQTFEGILTPGKYIKPVSLDLNQGIYTISILVNGYILASQRLILK